jgi:hypothetical protein
MHPENLYPPAETIREDRCDDAAHHRLMRLARR